jgi:hypothetical protein
MAAVNDRQQQRRFCAAVLLIVAVSLLLLLLIAHPADPHGLAVIGFVLIPVFLFGRVVIEDTMWPVDPKDDGRYCPVPDRPSLFQRPPPSIS